MTPDDTPIPDDDAIAQHARHALHRIAASQPIELSWSDVQTGARRVRQRRISVVGAACAVVLLGAGVAVAAAAGRDGTTHKDVRGETPATASSTSTTTSTSVPLSNGTTSPTTTLPQGGPIATAPPAGPTTPVGSSGPDVLQPQDGSWDATTSVASTRVTVGDTVTVHAELVNTGTQPQSTLGYGSLGIACDRWPIGAPNTDGIPFGQFLDWVVLQPGETHSFSISFVVEPEYVGSLICGVGLAFHGDAYAAGPYGFPEGTVTIDVVAAEATTTTTDTVPTTTIPG